MAHLLQRIHYQQPVHSWYQLLQQLYISSKTVRDSWKVKNPSKSVHNLAESFIYVKLLKRGERDSSNVPLQVVLVGDSLD